MGHLDGFDLYIILLLITCQNVCDVLGHYLPAEQPSQFRCDSGQFVPRLRVCDGEPDCQDASDELHCSHLPCKKDEFPCGNRRCVSPHLLCDGVDHCGDGSDEASCHNCTSSSSSFFVSCGPAGAPCLPGAKLCDGRPDCPDGRDEAGDLWCAAPHLTAPPPQTPPPSCLASEFRCGDGQCVPNSWRCDHSSDCSDGSDEDHCDQNECLVNNGGCSHVCVDQKLGFLCTCPSDMRLIGDSQCEDMDLCLDTDVCSQLCVEVNGSLTCDCQQGYQLIPNTGECKVKGDVAQLLFSSSVGVGRISTSGSEYRDLGFHLRGPGPLAALTGNPTLYLARRGQASIYRVTMDRKPPVPVPVLKSPGSVSALAVDWIHRLLYWTSGEPGSVRVGRLDGSTQWLLVGGLDRPTAVAVEPLLGLLFWAESGSSPKIERASLDGQDRMALVTAMIRNPVALSLDVPRQLLYWADAGTRTISRISLTGQHRKTVVESNGYLDRPSGLAVFEGFVYWSDEATDSICSADKHNGRHLRVLLSHATSPGGLVLLHPALQPNGPAVSGDTVTPCQHDCIPHLASGNPHATLDVMSKSRQNAHNGSGAVVSHTISASSFSDPTFAGVFSLVVLLSAVLLGMVLWRWRDEYAPSRSLNLQSFYLKESQDPLIIQGTCPGKETLLKLDLECRS